MHRSLMTPGREDLSPYPPIGQLDFEKIVAMTDEDLDRAFRERHGLQNIFKPGKPDYRSFNYMPEDDEDARLLELKRIVLTRLEGVGLGPNSKIWDWYDSVKENIDDPASSLGVILKNVLTDECKGRIKDVRENVAREAAVLVPYPRLQQLERQIQSKLRSMGQEPLSISDIFKVERLPSHAGDGLPSTRMNVETGLKLYLFKLEGLSNDACAERLQMDKNSMQTSWMIYFTPRAREIYRLAIGRKARYKGR